MADDVAIAALAEAAVHADRGEVGLAVALLSKADILTSHDVNVQHRAGVIYRAVGQPNAALMHFQKALSLFPNFHFTLIELGTTLLELKQIDAARETWEQAINSMPDYPISYLFLSRLELANGKSYAALEVLRRGRNHAQANLDLLSELAEREVYHGDRKAAAEALAHIISAGLATSSIHVRYMTLMCEIGDYVGVVKHRGGVEFEQGTPDCFLADLLSGQSRIALDYNYNALVEGARFRQNSSRWADVGTLRANLKSAIHDRRAFSMIRVGDGEARFLAYLDPEIKMLLSTAEQHAIGQTIWWNWFGAEIREVGAQDIVQLANQLSLSVRNADMIGVTTVARLERDHYHRGYLAYLDCYATTLLNHDPAIMAFDALGNNALHEADPFLAGLLGEQDWIGFICPHPNLAERLARHVGISAHSTTLIPGEMRLPDREGLSRGSDHFPNRFEGILKALTIPYPGAVVLVAAGLLGKIYCNRVKELGGIAIDIGSVADAWAGYETRPGQYLPLADWTLPA
jgi:tetratricopeptide (TPR) repeat protein